LASNPKKTKFENLDHNPETRIKP